VIEYVEKLGAELDVHGVGDGGYFGVLEDGHVEGVEVRTIEVVASGVSYDVRAELAARRSFWCTGGVVEEGVGCAAIKVCSRGWSERRGGGGRREAVGVDEVYSFASGWIASGKEVGEIHGKVSIKTCAERIVSSSYGDGEGCSGFSGEDSSQLPSIYQTVGKGVLEGGYGNIPDKVTGGDLTEIEVAWADTVRLLSEERNGDGIEEGIAGDGG
jgi:hypothetical protein